MRMKRNMNSCKTIVFRGHTVSERSIECNKDIDLALWLQVHLQAQIKQSYF